MKMILKICVGIIVFIFVLTILNSIYFYTEIKKTQGVVISQGNAIIQHKDVIEKVVDFLTKATSQNQ